MIKPTNDLSDKPARERILLTAHDLFYRDGIRATGIDKVIAASGVTKVTFYRHYPSKNDLIRAFLEYRHQRWMNWFSECLQRHGAQPGGGLAAIVPTLAEWFENPVFRGCAFINIVAELGDTVDDVISICRSHKQDMTDVIAELVPEHHDRIALANAVALAMDGAIIMAQRDIEIDGGKKALQGLACVLKALIENATLTNQ